MVRNGLSTAARGTFIFCVCNTTYRCSSFAGTRGKICQTLKPMGSVEFTSRLPSLTFSYIQGVANRHRRFCAMENRAGRRPASRFFCRRCLEVAPFLTLLHMHIVNDSALFRYASHASFDRSRQSIRFISTLHLSSRLHRRVRRSARVFYTSESSVHEFAMRSHDI